VKTTNNQLIICINIAILITLCQQFGRYGTNIFTKISCLSRRLAADYRAKRTHLPTSPQQDQGYVWAGEAPACNGLSGLRIPRHIGSGDFPLHAPILNQTTGKGFAGQRRNFSGKKT